MAAPLVSVVVPTYKRDRLLEQCLEALGLQDLGPDCYEIIVSDNAGSATTRQLVEDWGRENAVAVGVYLRVPAQGAGRRPERRLESGSGRNHCFHGR